MPRFEIWSEGYAATGESSGAQKHGESSGETFKEACTRFAKLHPEFKRYYAEASLTYWGCKLFDNEQDARRNYG